MKNILMNKEKVPSVWRPKRILKSKSIFLLIISTKDRKIFLLRKILKTLYSLSPKITCN